jgi:hypothetical protein
MTAPATTRASARESIAEAARRIRRETRAAQGLPPTIEDPAVLSRIANLMRPRTATPSTSAISPADGRPVPATTAGRRQATPPSPLGSPLGGSALDQVPPGRRERATTPSSAA